MAEDPELVGKPIAVAHLDPLRKGIILSPNYEARKFGIKTTILVREALLLCKDLIIVEPSFETYEHYSKLFFDYLYKITPILEISSIDEGYLDVTEVCTKIHPLALAEKIQKELVDEYQLPVSIGIAPNKFLAKMASDMKKPLGITVLRKREIDQFLWPLPIEDMFGIGKKTAPKLREVGINTIGDLAKLENLELLKKTIGEIYAQGLMERANGMDDSQVDASNDNSVASISNASTFNNDVYDPETIKKTMKILSNSIAFRLQQSFTKALTVGIQIKYSNFRLVRHSKGLTKPINSEAEMYTIAEDLLDEFFQQGDIIRLIGVFATRLVEDKQANQQVTIFDDLSKLEKEAEIQKIINGVKNTFGKDSINRGYTETKPKEKRNE